MKTAPSLLTFDVHTHIHPPQVVADSLAAARDVLAALGWRATFFVPASSARQLPDAIRALHADGHEIGCHGLTHAEDERFDTLPAAEQARRLREATAILTETIGAPVTAFRGPVFRISGPTLQILDELGYQADCSVNSQRLGLLGSDPGQVGWLTAPRQPYHPSAESPYRRGTLRLWEIPVSAWAVPLMTSTLQVFRPQCTRLLLRLFVRESVRTGKPLMYMLHPEDLLERAGRQGTYRFEWRHLWPSRAHGLVWRFAFYEMDWAVLARQSRALLRWLQQTQPLTSMTVRQCVAALSTPPTSSERLHEPYAASAITAMEGESWRA